MLGMYLIAFSIAGLFIVSLGVSIYCIIDPMKLGGLIRIAGIALLLILILVTGFTINGVLHY